MSDLDLHIYAAFFESRISSWMTSGPESLHAHFESPCSKKVGLNLAGLLWNPETSRSEYSEQNLNRNWILWPQFFTSQHPQMARAAPAVLSDVCPVPPVPPSVVSRCFREAFQKARAWWWESFSQTERETNGTNADVTKTNIFDYMVCK